MEYNNARGPYKGGIRYHQDTEINEVKALAFWMALKCAVADIPMGGGKGGITVDPKTLSKGELERLSRGWVRGMASYLGPQKDVPAPDVNTTPEIMAWMNDEFKKITGEKTDATLPASRSNKAARKAALQPPVSAVFMSSIPCAQSSACPSHAVWSSRASATSAATQERFS